MKLNKYFIISLIGVVLLQLNIFPKNKFNFEIETGWVSNTYNTIQVPNPGGDRFSLADSFNIESKIYYRLRLTYNLGNRHQLSALYAPLSFNANGIPNDDIRFQNSLFEREKPVDGFYMFNSYRLTYRYLLLDKETFKLWIGFTSKIRDAEITLTSAEKSDSTTNVGFVPLLNLYIDWMFTNKTGLFFEVDALAAPGGQGRAEDVALSFYYKISPNSLIKAGYRFVEGGGNTETVYSFAFLNYFHLGYQFQF